MTIKATFPDGAIMMFGDSYRDCWDQLGEYCRTFKKTRPFVEISSSKWIGFGGVKWCSFAGLQEKLDEEGEGRRAESFVFRPMNIIDQRIRARRRGKCGKWAPRMTAEKISGISSEHQII